VQLNLQGALGRFLVVFRSYSTKGQLERTQDLHHVLKGGKFACMLKYLIAPSD